MNIDLLPIEMVIEDIPCYLDAVFVAVTVVVVVVNGLGYVSNEKVLFMCIS